MAFYSVNRLASEFSRDRAAMIETQLVRCLEEMLDRVPSDLEVAHHCHRVMCSQADCHLEEFYWKDTFIFGIRTGDIKCVCYFDAPLIKRESP